MVSAHKLLSMITDICSFLIKSNSHIKVSMLMLKCVKGLFNTEKETAN